MITPERQRDVPPSQISAIKIGMRRTNMKGRVGVGGDTEIQRWKEKRGVERPDMHRRHQGSCQVGVDRGLMLVPKI